ncbi:hypothetical protein pb186bvf_018555 [Paramecium bursaria]
MSTVKIEEETSFFEHQFGEQILQPSPKNLIPFQNLLNECKIIKLQKQHQLIEPQKVRSKSPDIHINTKKLEEINEEIQLLECQKQSFQQMHNQLKYSIQSIQRNNNQMKQALQYYKDYDMVEMQSNDQEVISNLQTNTQRINAFQQLADKYKKQETKKLTLSKKDTRLQTEQLLSIQQKVSQLKQINEGLLSQIAQLKEEEAYKQKKLQECFKISEYIEFFIEIKSEFLQDDEDDSPSRTRSDSIRPRHSTRNEILNLMDEFYYSENINLLVNRIIKKHHQLEQEQNLLKIQFHDLNEEKTRLIKYFDELSDELVQYRHNICDEQSRLIKNGSQEITVNNIIVEGHKTQHFNYQIKYHIRVNQLCIISMYQKFQDLLTRMTLALVWLQEYTKMLPLKIDNICMQFLTQYTKQNFKLFIPKYNKIKSSQQKKGSFISLSNRAQTPISGFHSPRLKADFSDSDAMIESISRFEKCQEFEKIQELWKQLINNDLLTQKFTIEISLDGIDTQLDFQNIILKIYDKYAKQVRSSKYILHFDHFFQIYKDLINRIRKTHSQTEPDHSAISNLYFLKTTNQQQINRLIEAKQAQDIEEQKNHKMIKLYDESKYHEYFIIQSNKIQKKSPRIHENLISKTLQDIDNKKKLEMDQNYQTSELAQSEQDYLNQERRNLKGILNKKTSSQVSRQTTRLNDESFISQKTIIKQMVLMDKLSKLKLIKKNKEYFKLDLKSLNQSVQRKLSDHYQMQETPTHRFEPISSRKLKPIQSNTPVSRSYDPHQVFTPQSENILARVYDSTECFSKGKSFLVKR